MSPKLPSQIHLTLAAVTANHVAPRISERFVDLLDMTPQDKENRTRRRSGRKTELHSIFVRCFIQNRRSYPSMGEASTRIQQLREARSALARVVAHAANVVVIHYSCESFYDRSNGASPRITSIAVRNLSSAQTKSFSIHQIAERDKKVSIADIEENYDDLEKKMLKEFYEYVETHRTHLWLHWNMRDINYGFPAIAHRYMVLGGVPVDIHESQLVDLARILVGMFGVGYAGHPRLIWLVKENKISDRDLLNGEDEAKSFQARQYVRLHQSTLRKVDILANIALRTASGTLKTNATKIEIYGSYFRYFAELSREHWVVTLFGIIGSIASIIGLVLYFLDAANKTYNPSGGSGGF
jgi:hypothetical protein